MKTNTASKTSQNSAAAEKTDFAYFLEIQESPEEKANSAITLFLDMVSDFQDSLAFESYLKTLSRNC